ncbi:response regulator transcription factor [Candidatus Lucifugimonas marina]|uniref:Response regulator n=1 Tax=Candidatus Lucifugimonas marina TaxID=3038979 RepID=A0AAJ5ZGS0_9CHLR|nr:response regulator [SAR202 cluster bacterium JH702]MDG0870959.1 response regulator [SAR202 cluster bacterium JH639]WFG34715.1 response regulator [SAR202 cluster bacterium JH545]WFG38642.1 response regulator [SAR202 cluster bacterium JH1073]
MKLSAPMRLFVVDDHRIFTDGLIELLSSEDDFDVVGNASSISDAKLTICNANADAVIIDVHLPDGDGFLLHEWMTENCKSDLPKMLYVTGDDRVTSINRAITLGAMAYLDKTGGWEEVANALRRSATGSKTLGTNIASKLAEYSFTPETTDTELSLREKEILKGISNGLTAKEMAADLNLALPTVRTYVSRMFKKLGAKDRAHAVSIGYARGLIGS